MSIKKLKTQDKAANREQHNYTATDTTLLIMLHSGCSPTSKTP